MQWIVDIIRFKLAAYLQGKIFLWSGAIVDIPDGWAICNGKLGTPDLLDRFIVGSGNSYNPEDTGGTVRHFHSHQTSGLWHIVTGNTTIEAGSDFAKKTATHLFVGLTDAESTLSPYYALAYIMKL